MLNEPFTSFGLSFRFWIPIVAIILIAVAWYAYHATTPRVGGRLRVALVALRTTAFLLLIMMLLDPRVVRRVSRDEPARVVALVDHSASMTLPDSGWSDSGGSNRYRRAVALSEQLRRIIEQRGAAFEQAFFSDAVRFVSVDSVSADGQGTNIVTSLHQVSRRFEGENLAAVVVFSDGVETEQSLVRRSLPDVPVFAVGLGDTSAPDDVRIKEVDYNPFVRVPSRSVITASLEYTGDRQKRVVIKLTERGRTVFAKDTVMTPVVSEVVQEIPVRFPEAGRRQFELSVDVVGGNDAEPDNNRRDIVIEGEKARARVVIVDLLPNWELHFLTDFLRGDETFDYDVVSTIRSARDRIKDPAEFVSLLSAADAVVLASVTEEFFAVAVVDAIKRFVRERGGGLLVLPGQASLFEHPSAWNHLLDVLPVRGNPPFRFQLQYTSVIPGAQAGTNPITAQLLPLLSQTEWQERSPLLGYYTSVIPKAGVSEVLLNVKGRSAPAITYQTVGKGRVAVVSAGPLWRWKFLSENNSVYDEMISRLLDVLSRGEETDRFMITVKKNVFDAGESPVLFAEIFNEKMQPITGAPVRLELARVDQDGGDTPLDLITMRRESAENTRFKATLPPLPPGRYVVRGTAELADRTITSRPLEIQISSTSVEFQRVAQDKTALISMARRTGGSYADAGALATLASNIPLETMVVHSVSEMTVRSQVLLFLLILGLLSAEWIVRKRAGMI